MKFYDQLSDYYDLIYVDWGGTVERQGRALDAAISDKWSAAKKILDVSCGIGTQTLGLKQLGYDVTGSDLSEREIGKARIEAQKRGLEIPYSVCDMRNAFAHHGDGFDIAISCDNSIAHLLDDTALSNAFGSMNKCIKPGGGCLISLRDYESEPRGRNIYRPYGVRIKDGRRFVLYQIWDFDGDIYDLSFFFVEENLETLEVKTHVYRTQCYAVSVDHVADLLLKSGFEDVQIKRDIYFQPCILGTVPSPRTQHPLQYKAQR